MKKQLTMRRHVPSREMRRRGKEILARIQEDLLPEHANEIVAINVETGEYVLGATLSEAIDAFSRRWPDLVSYAIRVDGGPTVKFHGM